MEKTLDQKIWDASLEINAYSSNPEDHIAPIRKLIEQEVSAYKEELASLKEENDKLRNKTINEAIAAILSSEHTKSLAIMRAVNDIIKKVEALKSS